MSETTRLRVEAGLNLQDASSGEDGDPVRFEGVAVSPGVYEAEDDLRIRIREDHLDAVAAELEATQIRDLHEETVEATVGAVDEARVEDGQARFVGEVALEPHATIVREFPESIRFSVGFRFDATALDPDEGGVADLPEEFFVDHVAIVGRGQDPDARLTRLLNRARLGPTRTPDTDDTTDPSDDSDTTTEDDSIMDEEAAADLRRQRDEAIQEREQARADLQQAEDRLENMNDELQAARTEAEEAKADLAEAQDAAETARSEAEEARAELEAARGHFADAILKMELKAGEDLDLTRRRDELLELDLGELDERRLDLADELAEDPGPATKADTGTGASGGTGGGGEGVDLDLSDLSTRESIQLGLMKEVI